MSRFVNIISPPCPAALLDRGEHLTHAVSVGGSDCRPCTPNPNPLRWIAADRRAIPHPHLGDTTCAPLLLSRLSSLTLLPVSRSLTPRDTSASFTLWRGSSNASLLITALRRKTCCKKGAEVERGQ